MKEQLINNLNNIKHYENMDILIADQFGNYATFKEIKEVDGVLVIVTDNKHYIKKIDERKVEVETRKRY